MSPARITVLIVAIGAAALAVFMSRGLFGKGSDEAAAAPPPPAVVMAEVLVAAANVEPGHVMTPADYRWQKWPESDLAPNLITRAAMPTAAEAMAGRVARAPLIPGEPISPEKVIDANGGSYMSAIIKPGMRAVAVSISAETGAGGFILPNDRVDVIVTFAVRNDRGEQAYAAETVLTNIRVLAIDQAEREEGEENAIVGKTATLELTAQESEVLALASASGTVSLALRSLTPAEVAAADAGAADGGRIADPRFGADGGPKGTITVIRYGLSTTTAAGGR